MSALCSTHASASRVQHIYLPIIGVMLGELRLVCALHFMRRLLAAVVARAPLPIENHHDIFSMLHDGLHLPGLAKALRRV